MLTPTHRFALVWTKMQISTGLSPGSLMGGLNVIKSFYVKFERKIPEVVADFCTYYASHRNKTVVYYYDATALGSNYAVNEQYFRWVVVHDCSCQRGRAELVPAMPSAAELDHR